MGQLSKASVSFISESPAIGPSVVVHTTVTFGSEHLDSDPAEVQQLILSHLERIVPSLPKPASVKCQKWRYSQVLCGGGGLLGHHHSADLQCIARNGTSCDPVVFILRQQERRGRLLDIPPRSREQQPGLADGGQVISSHLFSGPGSGVRYAAPCKQGRSSVQGGSKSHVLPWDFYWCFTR